MKKSRFTEVQVAYAVATGGSRHASNGRVPQPADKASPYSAAITELKAEGKCLPDTVHRQVKYLNNIIEAEQGKHKR